MIEAQSPAHLNVLFAKTVTRLSLEVCAQTVRAY